MITEDYVSFETAKLLKEQGFKIPYDSFRGVYINGIFKRLNPGDAYGYNLGDEIVEVCSLQMVMKWLREEKNIIINVWYNGVDWDAEYYNNEDENFYLITDFSCNSYEEAAEAGIKYCLEKLI